MQFEQKTIYNLIFPVALVSKICIFPIFFCCFRDRSVETQAFLLDRVLVAEEIKLQCIMQDKHVHVATFYTRNI